MTLYEFYEFKHVSQWPDINSNFTNVCLNVPLSDDDSNRSYGMYSMNSKVYVDPNQNYDMNSKFKCESRILGVFNWSYNGDSLWIQNFPWLILIGASIWILFMIMNCDGLCELGMFDDPWWHKMQYLILNLKLKF